jgi:hypothetical protein
MQRAKPAPRRFLRDGLLVEIVEEAPIPEGVWQGKP